MHIDILSSSTVKVILNRRDMNDYDVKYENLTKKSPDTRRLLLEVLKSIKSEKNLCLDLSGERLFVEAFPRGDGGCMLYISGLDDECMPRSVSSPETGWLVCETDSLDGLAALCSVLLNYKTSSDTVFSSSLFTDGKKYRLAVNMGRHGERISGIMKEYGSLVGSGGYAIASTSELFRQIADGNAVETVAKALS